MTDCSAGVREGALLWTPSPARIAQANVTGFIAWLATRGVLLDDYDALWRWSVADLDAFWAALWDWCEVRSSAPYRAVLDRRTMPGARWFDGSLVNYAEHVLRHEASAAPGAVALHHVSERRGAGATTWAELGAAVRSLATRLRELGIRPGDCVVSCLPNVPEAVTAMLATTAIGAVWASASPDFGAPAIVDRFAQLRPRLLFAADGYRYAGRDIDRRAELAAIVAGLPTLETLVWLPYLDAQAVAPSGIASIAYGAALAGPPVAADAFAYQRVPCDHALWVLFSSGTTGLPKAIAHGHVGMLLEHLKVVRLHLDLRPGHVLFFHTTTGWMMWNVVVAGLLAGATAVLYDGSPLHPDADRLWAIAEAAGVTHFGASPTFVQGMQRAGLRPGARHDVRGLEMVTVSGSPCTPESFAWFHEAVKPDLWIASQSGGTEICSGFVGASPTLPVYAGEIQTRMLGMDVQAWDEAGEPLLDRVGELVVCRPFPSMPLHFVGDADGRRYREAYFERYPGVWCHGDFLRINARGGCYLYGRSDSTLNRHGVRIGTAEIYRVVERVAGVVDSLIVCCEYPDGTFYMPLFVRLAPGVELDATLREAIAARLREEASPRHVPDRIVAAPSVPYTLSGKKMEIPVRRILLGTPVERAASRDSMADPHALDFYVEQAAALAVERGARVARDAR